MTLIFLYQKTLKLSLSFGANFIGMNSKTPQFFFTFVEDCPSNLKITYVFGSESHIFKSSFFVSHVSEIPKTVFSRVSELIFLQACVFYLHFENTNEQVQIFLYLKQVL